MSPGELSNSDSNHGWSSSHHSLGSYGGGQGHRGGGGGGGGELPISDNNVTTTNGALDAAEWDLEAESDIDVSSSYDGGHQSLKTSISKCRLFYWCFCLGWWLAVL